jgi:hypothetical protein
VAGLEARAVGVHDRVLEVLLDRATVARVELVLLVPEALRTMLRYGWNNLTPKEKMHVCPKILDVVGVQVLLTKVLGGRALEQPVM